MVTGIFWAVAAAIALFVAVILARTLRGTVTELPAPEGYDRDLYRDQLGEIERDAARGVVAPDEAQRLRAEVARRLLEADRADPAPQPARNGPVWAGVALCGLMLAGAFGLYAVIGRPGAVDQPLAIRIAIAEERRAALPSQTEMEATLPAPAPSEEVDPDFADLIAQLRTRMATLPDDLTGQQLLARNEVRLGNLAAAHAAQAQVIRLKGADATADDHVVLATLMIQAAGGRVSASAQAALERALALNDRNDSAMFFLGIQNLQIGREDLAFRYWRKLVEVAPAESPWLAEVRPRMAELAALAGVPYRLPEPAAPTAVLPGPTPEMMEEAAKLAPGDQQAMIRGMVDQLSDRLATEGGTSEEWARLIQSLAVLGETERAEAILTEARGRFAGKAEDLAQIEVAARAAGFAP